MTDSEGNILAEYTPAGVERVHLPGIGYFIPAGRIESGIYVTMVDHLGTPRATIFQDGTVVQKTDLDPLGVPLPGSTVTLPGSAPAHFTHHQAYDDLSSRFHHAKARLYHPGLGRFLQADPLPELEPETSAYAYARNDFVSTVDPTGAWNIPALFTALQGAPLYHAWYDGPPIVVLGKRPSATAGSLSTVALRTKFGSEVWTLAAVFRAAERNGRLAHQILSEEQLGTDIAKAYFDYSINESRGEFAFAVAALSLEIFENVPLTRWLRLLKLGKIGRMVASGSNAGDSLLQFAKKQKRNPKLNLDEKELKGHTTNIDPAKWDNHSKGLERKLKDLNNKAILNGSRKRNQNKRWNK